MRFYLNKIVDLYEHGGEYEKAKCDALMALVAFTLLENVTGSEENKYVADIKYYISCNWNKKLTLEEIAASAHLSPSYSSALFKESTGTSIMDYIINLRIVKACDMLSIPTGWFRKLPKALGFAIFFISAVCSKSIWVFRRPNTALRKKRLYISFSSICLKGLKICFLKSVSLSSMSMFQRPSIFMILLIVSANLVHATAV